jgi:hypothetical protein
MNPIIRARRLPLSSSIRFLSSLPQPNNDFFKNLAMSFVPTVSDAVQRGKRTVLEMMAKRMSNDDAQIMLQHWSPFVNKTTTIEDVQKEIKTIKTSNIMFISKDILKKKLKVMVTLFYMLISLGLILSFGFNNNFT